MKTTTRLTPKFREDIREIAELTSDEELLRVAELPEVPVLLEHLRHVGRQTRILVGYRLDVTAAESPRLRRRHALPPDPGIMLHFDEVPFRTLREGSGVLAGGSRGPPGCRTRLTATASPTASVRAPAGPWWPGTTATTPATRSAAGCATTRTRFWLFTPQPAVDWTNNISERGAKAAKRHQAVSGYWHTQTTLARWCRIRSYLDSAASHGLTALDAVTTALNGKPWLPLPAIEIAA